MDDVEHLPPVADTWKWKRLRCIGVGIEFWPTAWGFGIHRRDDYYGGQIAIGLGPFVLTVSYNPMQGLFGYRCEADIPD